MLSVILFALNGKAQTPQVVPFAQAERMSKTVYNLFEDSSGKIWIGTDEGLYCWTGTELKHFFNSEFSYEYSEIKEDKQGRIWCLNFSAQLFYLENDSLKLFYSLKEYVSSTFDYSIDKYPDIYIGTDVGLLKIDFYSKKLRYPLIKKEGFIQANPTPDSLNNRFWINSLITHDNSLYFIHHSNLFQLKNNGELINVGQIQSEKVKRKNWEKDAFLCFSKKYIVSVLSFLENDQAISELGFYSTQESGQVFSQKCRGFVQTAFFDETTYWFGTTEGVQLFDNEQQRWSKYSILSNDAISSVIKDREGVMWISTTTNGVFRIPSLSILSLDGLNTDLEKDPIISMKSAGEHGLFMFSGNGKVLSKEGQKLKQLAVSEFSTEGPYFNPCRKELGFSQTETSYSLQKKQFLLNPYFNNVKCISFIEKGISLISTSGSARLTIINAKDTVRLKQLKLPYRQIYYPQPMNFYTKELRRQRSQFNYYDHLDSSIYVSYSDGLFLYSDFQEKELLWNGKSILITNLVGRKEGGVICSTVNGDLLEIDYPNIKHLTKLDFRIKKLLYHNNYLFLASRNAILKFNLKLKTKEWITVSDGLPSNRISDIELHNDSLYVASLNGVSVFSVDYTFKNLTKPIALIKEVQINFKKVPVKKKYELSHKHNNIEFSFGGIANRSNGGFLFQYRLLGIDSNWVSNSSAKNSVLFNTLLAGNYQFQLKVLNEDKTESTVKSINFSIEEPYYTKWWFYAICVAFIVGLVSAFFMVRIRILSRQNALEIEKSKTEQQLARTQLMALRSQMNPHFIFNALNSIQDYIINNNKELASDYLGLFADLIRKYLHFSNQEHISIDDEVESLSMYLDLEKVRFEESFNCEVIVDPNVDMEARIPVMLVQPFVENAIKHGLLHKKKNRELKVTFKQNLGEIEIEIYDNGIGRKAAAQINKMRNKNHQSYATSAQQKRINLINKQNQYYIKVLYQDLIGELNKPLGTIVNIHITYK